MLSQEITEILDNYDKEGYIHEKSNKNSLSSFTYLIPSFLSFRGHCNIYILNKIKIIVYSDHLYIKIKEVRKN